LRISFIVQAIGGVGSGANSVASMALMIAVSKREERDRNIGLFEAFVGLGFMTGPLVGSFLYTLGGYIMPFAFSGSFFVLCFPFVAYQLLKQKRANKLLEETKNKSFTSSESLINYNKVSFLRMFTVPRFLFGIGS
jgi:MFS family permease